MKPQGMITAAQFLNRHPNGSSLSEEVKKTVSTSIQIQESTDEAKLNKTEKAWLAILRNRGYEQLKIHPLTFKLADNTRYTPEFSAVVDGRIVIWEVKGGFIREDAWLKLKIAARMYPEFLFVMAKYDKKQWVETPIKP